MEKNIEMHNKILDHGKDGVIIIDKAYEITYANKSAHKILETEDSIIHMNVLQVFKIYDFYTKESYEGIIESVFKSHEPTGLKKESAIKTFKNRFIFISASISPIIEEEFEGAVIFFKDIMRLKDTEKALTKFRMAFEKSIESVMITNSTWEVEYVNERAKKNYKDCEHKGQCNFWDVVYYQLTFDDKDRILSVLGKKDYWVGELKGLNKKQSWFKVSIIVLRNLIGEIINYVISEVDITFEKTSKRLLLKERKSLSTIIDSAPVGMMTVNKEYQVLQINEACKSILGIPLKRSHNLLKSEEQFTSLKVILDLIEQVVEEQKSIRNYEFAIINNEVKRSIKVHVEPLELSEEKCVLLAFEDETVKKEMAKTIVRNERQLRFVTDHMHDTITQITSKGIIEYCSTSYHTLLGYESESLKNHLIYEIIHQEDFEILKRMIKKCEETHDSVKFEIRFINHKKESIWLEVMMKYIKNDLDPSFLLFGRDVTQRRISEQEMINSKEIAVAANNAKSEFLANMSHEIRTPLNGIIGMANVSLMAELPSKQSDNIKMIKHSAENLLKIINSVLDFSKIEAGKLTLEKHRFNLKAEMDKIIKPFVIEAGQKEIDFDLKVDEAINQILIGDPVRMAQVVNNILGNAIKFTEFGSVKCQVSLSKEDLKKQWITFRIEDTGIGIKNEHKDKIFTSFSQADGSITRKFGGTGLGLNITKKIIEMMQGEIFFESHYGQGTSFTCKLPFLKSLDIFDEEQKEKIVEADTVGVGYNILVVEDDVINQKLAQRLLKRKGFGITLVNNGQEAVDIYETGRFDLILMDIQMPIMDGITATQKIREISSEYIPIIALTAYAIKGDREKFLSKGMDDYISKPIDLDEFYKILDKHLKPKKEDNSSILRILDKLQSTPKEAENEVAVIIDNHFDKLNMQLKYIGSSISKKHYEKLEERCYAFKNYVTSIHLSQLRKLIFSLELDIRKENDDKIVDSFKAIIEYVNANSQVALKGVDINENINSRG